MAFRARGAKAHHDPIARDFHRRALVHLKALRQAVQTEFISLIQPPGHDDRLRILFDIDPDGGAVLTEMKHAVPRVFGRSGQAHHRSIANHPFHGLPP